MKEGKRLGLELTFNRTGDSSSYGSVLVELQRDSDSPVEQIGEFGEIAVHKENDKHNVTAPLRDERIPQGALVRVVYERHSDYEGILWAENYFKPSKTKILAETKQKN